MMDDLVSEGADVGTKNGFASIVARANARPSAAGRAGTHVEPSGDGPDGAIDAADGSLDHVTGPDKVVVDVRLPAHGDLSLACAKKCAHPLVRLVSSRTIAKVSLPEPCHRHIT